MVLYAKFKRISKKIYTILHWKINDPIKVMESFGFLIILYFQFFLRYQIELSGFSMRSTHLKYLIYLDKHIMHT